MVDKADIIPKEVIGPFFDEVKKNLAEIPKEGEKKIFYLK